VKEPYDILGDHRLASLLRAGDPEAFKVIYDRYWDRLLVVAANRLGDVLEAEEAVQDIFLNLWRRRESFELKVSFENYLAVAVKFEVINRRAKRVREETLRLELGALPSPVGNDKHTFDLEYLQRQLEQTINSLPPKCRLVFRLSRDDDYTNKQIAEQLGISEKAVEKQVTKALKALRERLGKYYSLFAIIYLQRPVRGVCTMIRPSKRCSLNEQNRFYRPFF